jgi:hypothetical protein
VGVHVSKWGVLNDQAVGLAKLIKQNDWFSVCQLASDEWQFITFSLLIKLPFRVL